ncbi:PQQ-binding-like beta-propeller repeat protein [Rhizohabitans arisaemae]|uniref:outer membrane protein assembly factor BamB family protein n=1 Tax=Rhizohabitans arisaemae TaxID=2720610 RepID=UPI0024B0A12E|nr:PQQ-binding-like beta-propeller repeat protein [Rhizohabitans arisaemae]
MPAFNPLQPEDPSRVGPYRILARLGSGGMGRVYLGRSRGGRAVAVKVVRAELADDAEFRLRFAREVALARTVGGFFTAGVVDADPEGRPPWLATAYVPGLSLEEAVERHGPWPEASVRALGAGLAEALESIHSAGVVHRDFKPSNVLLTADGPRVIDFGISIAVDGSRLTHTGALVGTPGFMTPEQLTGDPVGPPGDVFCLGAILVYTATGTGPFGTGSWQGLWYRIVHDAPRLDGLSPGLRAVVAPCLDKRPERRPTSTALVDELGADADGAAVAELFTGAAWLPHPVGHALRTDAVTKLPVTPPLTGPSGQVTPAAPGEPAPPRRTKPLDSADKATDALQVGEPGGSPKTIKQERRHTSAETSPPQPTTTPAEPSHQRYPPDQSGDPAPLESTSVDSADKATDVPQVGEPGGSPETIKQERRGASAKPSPPEPTPAEPSHQGHPPDQSGDPAPLESTSIVPGHTGGRALPAQARDGRADPGRSGRPRAGVSRRQALLALTGVGATAAGFAVWRSLPEENPATAKRTTPSPTPERQRPSLGTLLWSFPASRLHGRPAVVDGVVYIGGASRKLHAVDTIGKQRWVFTTRGELLSSPAVAEGTVYIGGDDGRLYAIDTQTGQQRWTFATNSAIQSAPTIANGVVYVGSDDRRLYAVDARTGQQRWAFNAGDVPGSPLVSNRKVYFGGHGGRLHAVDTATGKESWTFTTGESVFRDPAVFDGTVYTSNEEGLLLALDAQSGKERWTFTADTSLWPPAVADGIVYIGGSDRKLYAIDGRTGKQRWTFTTGGLIESSPDVADGIVYIGGSDRKLYAIDAQTREQRWTFTTKSGIYSSPTVADDTVYIASGGTLYALAM